MWSGRVFPAFGRSGAVHSGEARSHHTPEVLMTVMATPRPTGHPGYSETLDRVPESAAVARRLVRTALTAWGLEDLIEDATLVITELVSNAVDHGCLPS